MTVRINGNYFICGATNTNDNLEKYQPKVIKIDGLGNVDWQLTLKSNSKDYHQFRATSTRSSEVIVVGSSLNEVADEYKSDAFLTKINYNVNIIWSYPFCSIDEDDWGLSVFETPEKNIVFVAAAANNGSSNDIKEVYPAYAPYKNVISVSASSIDDTKYLTAKRGSK